MHTPQKAYSLPILRSILKSEEEYPKGLSVLPGFEDYVEWPGAHVDEIIRMVPGGICPSVEDHALTPGGKSSGGVVRIDSMVRNVLYRELLPKELIINVGDATFKLTEKGRSRLGLSARSCNDGG